MITASDTTLATEAQPQGRLLELPIWRNLQARKSPAITVVTDAEYTLAPEDQHPGRFLELPLWRNS